MIYRFIDWSRFHPYVGGGIAFGVFWEKSGMLDSTDLRPSAGPTITAGFDYDVSPFVVFSTEFRARWLTTEIESEGSKSAALSLNPSTLSVGIGFRF